MMKKLMLIVLLLVSVTFGSSAKKQTPNYTFHTTCGYTVVIYVQEGEHWTDQHLTSFAQALDHELCGTNNVPVTIV